MANRTSRSRSSGSALSVQSSWLRPAPKARRPSWFRYVCDEVAAAIAAGIGIEGICLYPIVNHPGWINNRHCHNGLGDYADRRASVRSPCPLRTSSSNKWRPLEIIRRCAAFSRELLTWGNGETARKSAEGISALRIALTSTENETDAPAQERGGLPCPDLAR
jgi:hypothetical protein